MKSHSVRLIAITLALFARSTANAVLVDTVDQSYPPKSADAGGLLMAGGFLVGQSFTAGLTGDLVAVRVDVYDFAPPGYGYKLEISIRDIVGGTPVDLPLSSATLSSAQSPYSSVINLLMPVPIVAGREYLIGSQLIGDDASYSDWCWFGHFGDSGFYPRGQIYIYDPARPPGGSLWFANPEFDLFFQTVVRVPEPATWSFATVCLFAFRRLRRDSTSGEPSRLEPGAFTERGLERPLFSPFLLPLHHLK